MRSSIAMAVATVAILISSDGHADAPPWSGPGWYLLNDFALGIWTIEEGPYATQDQCQAALSAQKDSDHRCAYLNTEADYDKIN